jgi:hypothetical protein
MDANHRAGMEGREIASLSLQSTFALPGVGLREFARSSAKQKIIWRDWPEIVVSWNEDPNLQFEKMTAMNESVQKTASAASLNANAISWSAGTLGRPGSTCHDSYFTFSVLPENHA